MWLWKEAQRKNKIKIRKYIQKKIEKNNLVCSVVSFGHLGVKILHLIIPAARFSSVLINDASHIMPRLNASGHVPCHLPSKNTGNARVSATQGVEGLTVSTRANQINFKNGFTRTREGFMDLPATFPLIFI